MKPVFAFLFAALFMGIAPSLPALVLGGNRPTADNAFLMLNGEATRDLNTVAGTGLADGGGATLWTIDAGIGCNLVSTGTPYEMHCNTAGYFCVNQDGGCSATIGSPNFGRPVNASTSNAPAPYFFTPQTDTASTRLVCYTPVSTSATGTCALFRLR